MIMRILESAQWRNLSMLNKITTLTYIISVKKTMHEKTVYADFQQQKNEIEDKEVFLNIKNYVLDITFH